jgi:hypothetical protein
MFKLVSVIILLLIIVLLLLILILKCIIKLYVNNKIVKYKTNNLSNWIFNKYGTKGTMADIIEDDIVFYYVDNWSIKNNNYVNVDNKYYILESGYYYYIANKTNLTVNNKDSKIILLNNKNKIKNND